MSPAQIATGLRARLARLPLSPFAPVRGAPRPTTAPDLSAAVPFEYDLDTVVPPGAIGVVCHLFHMDLIGELRELINNIPFPANLFISTDTQDKQRKIAASFSDWDQGRVDVRVAANRGRDIGPKLITFRDVYDEHELILFLHSKKSLHSRFGDAWRTTLTQTLSGSVDTVRSVVDIFCRHPEIGIVASQHFEPIREFVHWDGNFSVSRRLARRIGFQLGARHMLDMPSGSMFWVRSAAMRPLLALDLSSADFPPEENQTNKTVQHAIERLFLFVCEHAGFQWIKIADRRYFDDQASIRTIGSPLALDVFIKQFSISLLTPQRSTMRRQRAT